MGSKEGDFLTVSRRLDVTRWIGVNSDALIDYWNGAIDTLEIDAAIASIAEGRVKRRGSAFGTPQFRFTG